MAAAERKSAEIGAYTIVTRNSFEPGTLGYIHFPHELENKQRPTEMFGYNPYLYPVQKIGLRSVELAKVITLSHHKALTRNGINVKNIGELLNLIPGDLDVLTQNIRDYYLNQIKLIMNQSAKGPAVLTAEALMNKPYRPLSPEDDILALTIVSNIISGAYHDKPRAQEALRLRFGFVDGILHTPSQLKEIGLIKETTQLTGLIDMLRISARVNYYDTPNSSERFSSVITLLEKQKLHSPDSKADK